MGYRGRLIHRFNVEVYRLDAVETDAVGYDDDFREPVRVSSPVGAARGSSARREMAAIVVPCQYEPSKFRERGDTPVGDSPSTSVEFILHLADLERMSLVGTDGLPKFRVGDRVSRLLDQSGSLVQSFDNLFVDKVEPEGFGFGIRNTKRNLVVLTCSARAKGF